MPAAAPAATEYLSPLNMNWADKISLAFGSILPQKFGGGIQRAIDIAVPTGTPIYAPANGIVNFAGWNKGGGNYLTVLHTGDVQTGFAHLAAFAPGVAKGAEVTKGQLIGFTGNTGAYTTGPHLLFEVKVKGQPVNPLDLFNPTGKGINPAEYKRPRLVPRNPDGSCPIGYIPGAQTQAFNCVAVEALGDVPIIGGALQGAQTASDLIGKLFDPAFWAALLAVLGGAILVFIGGKMVWDAV